MALGKSGGREREQGETVTLTASGRGALIARVQETLERVNDRDECLRSVVRILSEGVPKYTWTGIYLLEGDSLVLHNQIGLPTPHQTIPIGQGICGLAARDGKTVVVPDVGKDARYLICSPATRSEIVVPIVKEGGEVAGEIDIDSDRLDAFDGEDRLLLEETAKLISSVL